MFSFLSPPTLCWSKFICEEVTNPTIPGCIIHSFSSHLKAKHSVLWCYIFHSNSEPKRESRVQGISVYAEAMMVEPDLRRQKKFIGLRGMAGHRHRSCDGAN